MIRINLLIEGANAPAGGAGGAGLLRDPGIRLLLALVLAGGAAIGYFDHTQTVRHTGLVTEVRKRMADSTALDEAVYETDRLRRTRDLVNTRISTISTIDGGRYTWAHIFDEITNAVPSDLWIETIEEPQLRGKLVDSTTTHVRVTGYAASPEKVTEFFRALEDSPFLKNASFTNTEATKVAGGQAAIHFSVEAQVETPDPTLLDVEKIGADGRVVEPAARHADAKGRSPADSVAASKDIPLIPAPESLPSRIPKP